MLDTTRPEPLRSPLLDRERENGVKHGFFTRAGGVSTGLYEGLNVGYGSGDDRETVTENRPPCCSQVWSNVMRRTH